MPKIGACIVLELVFMFVYAVLVLLCWGEWKSPRQHFMAWLALLFYLFFWGKTSHHFVFRTFGTILRETRINSDQPVEESYNLGGMAALMLAASVVTFYQF